MSLPLTPDDRIILVDFGLGLYRALCERNVRPVVVYHKLKAREEKNPSKDPCIMNFDETREARFGWPNRREYLKDPHYQEYIDEAYRQATSNSFYTRFFTRDQGRRSYYFVKRWSWLEMNNFIYKSLYHFLDLLVTKQINKVLFSDVPHEGSYVLLYLLARAMGIDCIVCFQSLFANKFFVLRNAPFGNLFKLEYLLPPQSPSPPMALPTIEKPFYMKRVKSKRSLWSSRSKNFLKLLVKTLLFSWMLKPRRYKQIFLRFWKNLEPLPPTRDPKFTSDFDPRKKYVYFPFHLQPEMTTDSLGRQYADQLLVMEKLLAILPEDWLIYCKENPKQKRFMRGRDFHERLTAIPNVVLVHDTCDSFELTRHSQFVATITGTAGWEALRMGKKVLLYGDVWYQGLPGVYEAETVKTVEDMDLDTPVDQEALRQGFANLSCLLHAGCVNRAYRVLIKNYDDVSNGRLVASSLCGN